MFFHCEAEEEEEEAEMLIGIRALTGPDDFCQKSE